MALLLAGPFTPLSCWSAILRAGAATALASVVIARGPSTHRTRSGFTVTLAFAAGVLRPVCTATGNPQPTAQNAGPRTARLTINALVQRGTKATLSSSLTPITPTTTTYTWAAHADSHDPHDATRLWRAELEIRPVSGRSTEAACPRLGFKARPSQPLVSGDQGRIDHARGAVVTRIGPPGGSKPRVGSNSLRPTRGRPVLLAACVDTQVYVPTWLKRPP